MEQGVETDGFYIPRRRHRRLRTRTPLKKPFLGSFLLHSQHSMLRRPRSRSLLSL